MFLWRNKKNIGTFLLKKGLLYGAMISNDFFCFQFNLQTWMIGVMFLIAPGLYGVTAPIFGYLGDKGVGENLCHPPLLVI